MFFVLKLEQGGLTYYESIPRRLTRDAVEHSDKELREIVQLVCERVCFCSWVYLLILNLGVF